METKENIILKTYSLLLFLLPYLEKVPKKQKYLLSDRIETKGLDILEQLIEAFYLPAGVQKKEIVRKTNISIEQLRYLIRFLHDLKYISHEQYGAISERVDEIGRLCGGWEKALR